MGMLKSIWNWLLSLLGMGPGAESGDAAEEEPPVMNRPQTPRSPKTPREAKDAARAVEPELTTSRKVEQMSTVLERRAEEFELDQSAFVEFLAGVDRDLVEAAWAYVDWPSVVSGYSDKALRRIQESATNIQFTKAHAGHMNDYVIAEISRRAANAPDADLGGLSLGGLPDEQ